MWPRCAQSTALRARLLRGAPGGEDLPEERVTLARLLRADRNLNEHGARVSSHLLLFHEQVLHKFSEG